MKPVYLFRFLSIVLILSGLRPISAQTVDGPVGVAVAIKGVNLQWGSNGSPYLDLSVVGLNDYQSASASYESETPQLTARLEPGKSYYLNVSSEDLDYLTIQAVPPPGYVMEIERVARERYDLGYAGYTSVQIRVLAPMQAYSGRAGTATALTSGRVFWQVALGSLANGSSAGALAIIDTGVTSFSSLFTPAGFLYESTSSEVQVFYTPWWVSAPEIPGTIRQIIAPEACVDVITVGPNECHIKFYHRNQLVPGSGLRSFTGAPYAWYLINQNGAEPNRVYINCDIRELPNLTEVEPAIVETKHTVLERTGAAPDFSWTADEWYDDGSTSLSRDARVRSEGVESIAIGVPSGATATSRTRTYGSVPWGEEIVAESAGTTNTVTTSRDFYTASDQAGNYGRPRSTSTTGGSWEAYEYYDYAGNTADVAGALYRTHAPFKNSATSVPANLSTHTDGVVTEYAYANDAFGRRTRPTVVETKIGGVTTARSSTTYSDSASGFTGHAALYLVTATTSVSSSSSDTLTTISKYFREDAGAYSSYASDDFFRGQMHSIQLPDGRKQSFVYQRGTWDGSTFTTSGNNGTDYGSASRIAVINGTSGTGTSYTSYSGYDIDDLYLVDKQSTMDVTIRDVSALIRRTETYVWSSNAWALVASVSYGYNYSNLLVSRVNSNGGQYEASYSGEHKDWEKDDSGIRIDYTYDAAGRVSTATKSGGPKTTLSYDAEYRPLSETISIEGTAETISTNRTYDNAGRLKTELPVGMSTINYSYDPAARTRTTTFPDTGTRTETYFADGQLDHVDGSAVVPQYFAYTVASDGKRTVQTNSGTSTSVRCQKGTIDWLGRLTHGERPGFSISSQAASTEDNTFETGTGRLTKTARSGLAPTRYEYDAFSRVKRTGLDIGDNGLVNDSGDRISENEQIFESIANNWWLRQETKTYPFANGTAVTTSVSRKRLTGFPSGRLEETQDTDVEGNTVTRTVDVDRATATATITTTRPSVANDQVETVVNGLATSVTGHDGLTNSIEYDSLNRPWKSTDSRGNTVTTAYKYGSALVETVTDGASNVVSTISYDSMGRRQWVKNADGQYTRFTYNLRGQLTNQWGGGSYPVSYGYDSTYGDQTSLSTYRSAPSGDSTTWPTVGTADTTTWTYDGASALLWKKTDAGSQVTEFDYNVRGQTNTRKWARKLTTAGMTTTPVTTTYGYDDNTGELLTQGYNDTAEVIPTPPVTYHYTRLGQVDSVADGTGSRSLNFNATAPWRMDNETLSSGFYASRVITRNYDASSGTGGTYGSYTPGFFKGRYIGYDLGIAGNTSRDQHIAYATSNLGRFVGVNTRVTTSSARDYVYSYTSSSSLVGGYAMGTSFSLTRGYETQRNVVTSIDSQWGGASVTRYDYTTNALGQRTTAKQKGSAYGDYVQGLSYGATYNVYNYNSRGELQTTARYRGDTPTTTPNAADELPARRFEYRYDSIGNRTTSGSTGTSADDAYTRNALNQYTGKETKAVKVIGTAATSANVAVSGASSTGKNDHAWGADLAPANSSGPVQASVTVTSVLTGAGTGGADLVRTDNSRTYFVPKQAQVISYDADGNLISDGVWTYTYNAENQLVRMSSELPAGFTNRRLRLDFKYDYSGRRVEKRVFDNDTNSETLARRYLYDGANVIAESDTSGNLQRVFTWGLDLAGSLSATGGVGALLQIDDLAAGKVLLATYDGNGNVAALVNSANGNLEAAYEYDPSGTLLRCEGAYANNNPFRFSTKWQDNETGLVNFGARYYSPTLGRFINRDPIAEKGGLNLYGFCGNDAINNTDYLGHSWLSRFLKFTRKATRDILNVATLGTLRAPINHLYTWGENHQQELKIAAAIVASIFTYGAASGWAAGLMSSSVTAGTISATTAGMLAGAVGGAAAGFVGSGIMTGNLQQALRGAAAGAIMGGASGYFGNTWNATRVAATAVAGGTGSEIMGGDFRTGFIVAGAFAAARWGWEAIKNSVDKSSLSSTYDKSVNSDPRAPSSPQYDENGLLRTDGGRPDILEAGRSVKAENWFTRSGMAREGSVNHIYDSGQWVEQHLGGTVAQFARTFVNAVSKIHDFQNSWGYDSVGRFVTRSEFYNTAFQAYSMVGMPVAGLTTAGLFIGANPQVQQQYFLSRREGDGG